MFACQNKNNKLLIVTKPQEIKMVCGIPEMNIDRVFSSSSICVVIQNVDINGASTTGDSKYIQSKSSTNCSYFNIKIKE